MTECFGCDGTLNDDQCTSCGESWHKCEVCNEMSSKMVMVANGSSYDEVPECKNSDCDSFNG